MRAAGLEETDRVVANVSAEGGARLARFCPCVDDASTQASMLTTVRRTSSCCTGAFTGEMSLAVVERTVNTCSKTKLGVPVSYQPLKAHETCMYKVFFFACSLRLAHGIIVSIPLEFASKEIDGTCRQLIQDHVRWCARTVQTYNPPPCVHGDVTEILPEGTLSGYEDYPAMVRAVNKSALCRYQFCYTHNMDCPVFSDPQRNVDTDYDISGLPCPDFSRAGLQRFEHGATSVVFACHAKMHCHKQTKMLLIENVPATRAETL